MRTRLALGISASALILFVLATPVLARHRKGAPTGPQISRRGPTGPKISRHGPTAAQIRHAISRARQSPNLWATVNICNTARYPDVIGIRGQMPSLGFTTTLYMTFQVDYYSIADQRFEPDPGISKLIRLGRGTHGSHQIGVIFRIKPPAILSGTVRFEWRRAGRVLGRASRKTSHGEHQVDFGDPPGYSTATCRFG